LVSRALLHAQDGDLATAREDVATLRHGEPRSSIAFEARRLLAEGLILTLSGADASAAIQQGTQLAILQGATLWARYGETLAGLSKTDRDPSPIIDSAAHDLDISSRDASQIACSSKTWVESGSTWGHERLRAAIFGGRSWRCYASYYRRRTSHRPEMKSSRACGQTAIPIRR